MSLKIGVIGFGWMAYYHYQHIIPKDEGISIVAAYDIAPERKEFIEKLGIQSYATLRSFLKSQVFDTVLIAVPNDLHREISIASMRAGKNVICEKPAALNAEELEEMIAVSSECGVVFTVHQNRRRDADFLSVRKVLEDGTIGKPFLIESRVNGSNGIPSDWRRVKESGGGMLLDWGPHLVDQMLTLVDSPLVEIYAQLMRVKYEVDDNFRIQLKFENGVCAQIEVSTNCFLPLPRWHVLGEEGTLNIANFKNEGSIVRGTVKEIDWSLESVNNYAGSTRTMRPRPDNTIETLENPKMTTDWMEFYRNYKAVLEGRAQLLVRPEESLRTTKVIDFASESDATGKAIRCRI